MNQKTLKDIVNILKDQTLEEVLEQNAGIRRGYCQRILSGNSTFFIRAINHNLYDTLKEFYIHKKKPSSFEELKKEEIEMIKKFIIFSNLKELDSSTLEKLRVANEVMLSRDMDSKIEQNVEFRQKIIDFIKQNDKTFYNSYVKRFNNLNDKNIQINMLREYNEYLKKTS